MKHDIARRQDDLIGTIDEIDEAKLARSLDPALRDALLERVVDEPLPEPSWRRAHRRLAIALGVGGALVVSTAGAYAGQEVWQRLHPDQSVVVGCVDSQDAEHQPLGTSFPIPTGDPLADCAAAWELQYGEPAPELAAYTGPSGQVLVQPEAWVAPADWEPLPVGFALDTSLIELDHSLQDSLHGLESGCFSEDEGRAQVEATLARLGIAGWKVDQRDDPDGEESCAAFVGADPEAKVVMLMALENGAPAGLPYEKMAAELRKAPACLDRKEALAAVGRAAEAAGIPEGIEGYQLADPGAKSGEDDAGEPGCVRIVMLVFGGITVELWG